MRQPTFFRLGKSCNSDENNRPTIERVARENEALRGELAAASSPSTLQSEAAERLDRMAQSAVESEYKWSARVPDLESKLDVLRRENTAFPKEYQVLKSELNEKEGGRMVHESAVEGERRLREMEGKLQRDRKEMDRLIQEENGLIVELRGCRDLLESARMQCDTYNTNTNVD